MVGPTELCQPGGEAIRQDRLECHEVIAKYPSTLRGNVTVEIPPLQGGGMNALVVGQLHSPVEYGRGRRFGRWARREGVGLGMEALLTLVWVWELERESGMASR